MEPTGAFDQQGMALFYYWRLFRKRLWLIIALVLVSVTVGLIYMAKTRPLYRATAKLLIERETPKLVLFADIMPPDKASDAQTQYRILQSRSLAQKVIETMQLRSHAEFAPAEAKPNGLQTLQHLAGALLASVMEWLRQFGAPQESSVTPDATAATAPTTDLEATLVSDFLSRLTVKPIPDTNLVNLSFEAHDPRLAAEVVNTLVRLYIDQNLAMRFATIEEALDWLNKRVKEMAQKVETTDLALQRYKEQYNIFSIDDRMPGVMQQLAALDAALLTARTERIGLETLNKEIQNVAGRPEMMEWAPAVVESTLIQSLKTTFVDLQRNFAQLEQKYGPKHPSIIQLASQMDTVKQKIRLEVQKIVEATKAKYQVAKAREAALLDHVDRLKQEAQDLNKKAVRYGVLKRDAESNKQLYDLLLTRLKETSLNTELKGGNNIRIIDPAEVPRASINILPARHMTMATLIGLVLGVSLVLFIGYLDNTLKTPEEIEELLGLPIIGVIGRFQRRRGTEQERRDTNQDRQVDLITVREPHSQATEGFKMLRTNLLFSYTDTPHKVFLITSPHPKEGKTTVAANLAAVVEQTERRVLLVDCDMRNPALHKIFGLSDNAPGLSDLLLTEKYEDTLKVFAGNLTVVPAGTLPPNPSELLGSQRMQRFVEFARAHYDIVILDSPPVLAVSDALVLTSLVDGSLVVLRANSTSRDHARRTIAQIAALQIEPSSNSNGSNGAERGTGNGGVLGLLLNFFDPREDSSYGYYRYHYYYYRSRGSSNSSSSDAA